MATAIIHPRTKKSLQEAIVDLYLNVKVRSGNEVSESAIQASQLDLTADGGEKGKGEGKTPQA